jgi:alanyl-tRNA synthetase
MGLERLAMVSQNAPTIFETDLLQELATWIPGLPDEKHRRVVADHARGIAFLLADGVLPSNKGTGYILRRLMRRMLAYEVMFHTSQSLSETILKHVIQKYGDFYTALSENADTVVQHMFEERERFSAALGRGLKELERTQDFSAGGAFKLYESYGLPYEIIKEVGKEKANALTRDDFDREFEKHQEVSRAGVEKKFGGHGLLLDTGELKAGSEEDLKKVTRLHTATHLLQWALREVLGGGVGQMGSDITVERTRFDFTFSRKLTPEEIARITALVNEKVSEDLPVSFVEMSKTEAEKSGALHFFKVKYPEQVKVYYVGDSLENAYSKEFCGGPHVTHTGEIGAFKIIKEESVAAGVRRIRAIIE